MNPATYVALVIGLSVGAQWLGWRLRLPALLFMLVIGFGLGQIVSPDKVFGRDLLFAGVNLCVAIILFEGALSLKLRPVRDLGRPILRLCTVTVAVCWVLIALTAWALGFDLRVALLLGAILVVTGPTVINPILRQLRPTRRVSGLLRWEGIIVDPIGAVLAVLVYQGVTSIEGASVWREVGRLGLTVLVALVVAVPVGLGVAALLRRHLIPDFLQGVVFVGIALGTVVGADLILDESGLLAVTALGILLANQPGIELDRVLEFKENLQVLLVGALFVMLAGRVTPAELAGVAPMGLVLVAALVLVVRPASVLLGLAGTETTRQERTLMCFMAPRGIVAASITAIFALQFSQAAGNVRSQATAAMGSDPRRARALMGFADRLAGLSSQVDRMVPLVFFVIVCTVAVYGLGIGRLAERLGLASASPRGVMFAGTPAWSIDAARALRELDVPTMFVTRRSYDLAAVRAAGLRCEAADFLSEYAVDEMDLSGIASMVAVTPDDNVNSIGSVHYRRALGRSNVFQLRRTDEGEAGDRASGTVSTLKALTAFSPSLDHAGMEAAWRSGARVHRVRLTPSFSWLRLRQACPGAVALFIVRPGSVTVATESIATPKAGDVVIYLGDDVDGRAVEDG